MGRTILFNFIILFILSGNLVNAKTTVETEKEIIEEEMFAFPGWNRKQAIDIQSSKVYGAISHIDFPVLITLDHLNSEIVDGGANSALNGGGDIRFSSDSAGNNQLAIEVVEFITSSTASNRKCQIWVKIPSLSATTNTTIYIWYNKTGEVQPAASSTYGSEAVWSANYVSIWHMEENPGATTPQIKDSGAASNHGTSVGSMETNDSQQGQIGNGVVFNGDNQLINVGNSSSLNLTSNFTISGWFNPTHFHDFYVMAKRSETVSNGYNILPQAEQDLEYFDGNIQDTGLNYNINQWNYAVIKMNSNGNGIIAFLNNTFSAEITVATLPDGLGQNLYLGGRSSNTLEIGGELDELRVSNTYRSNGWISTEYNNQLNPSTFAFAGTPESVSGGGGGDTQAPSAPTNPSSPGKSDTTADLSWNAATDNVGVTNYRVYRDNNLEATLGNVGTYAVTGLMASTTYSFTITALDAAGNEGPASTAISVTTDASSGGGGSGSSVWSEANSVASYSGDVAIGTTTVPTGYKMAIDGKLITEEVKVQLSGNWPDYVFMEDYDLPTLEKIQKHIKEKGHLPNIPSAKEVEENGVELGEMNRLLLEKIEELTLYMLQQQNELKKHKSINQKLERRLNQLENLLRTDEKKENQKPKQNRK
ncbi:DUF2341 domain-containing protein [Flagellimonas sp. S3867]|uniref:DUF2341 domain-containing protein n=1 Tax=Flagellimonas sp. S3867 TaxID=2768063 RepID=UPI001686D759|nr:DUF2341 domain-containing protein [Flagellimonas sp. S3867]